MVHRSRALQSAEADARYPVRLRVAIPPGGLGTRLPQIHEWLDANCGPDNWLITPAGLRGVVNDALAIYFLDPHLAAAFAARWCKSHAPDTEAGALLVREDELPRRLAGKPHG